MQLQRKQLGLVQTDWEIQEGELELAALSAKLTPREIKVVQYFMEGHPLIECGTLAGFATDDPRDIPRLVYQILQKPEAQQYLSTAKRVFTQRAMQQVCYDKIQWMQDMQSVLNKALGREKTNFVAVSEGQAYEHKVIKDDLPAAQKALDTIGKTFGWLTEKKELTVEHKAVVRVRDFSGKGNHLDISAESSQDELLLAQINEELVAETELIQGRYETKNPDKVYVDTPPKLHLDDDYDPTPEWDRPVSVEDDAKPKQTPAGKLAPHVVRVPVAVAEGEATQINKTTPEEWE